MSALPPKADKRETSPYVRFVPQADICGAANCSLFDHLVGAHKQCSRYGDAKRPGGLEVNDQFDFGRLLHWQITRLLALENAAGVHANQTVLIHDAAAVAH